MKNIISTLCVCVFFTGFYSLGNAADKQIRLTGAGTSYKYSQLTPGATLSLYGVSKGNSSNTVKISVYGPSSVKVTASAAKVDRTIQATLANTKAFYPISVRTDKELDSNHKKCVDFSLGDALSEEEPNWV